MNCLYCGRPTPAGKTRPAKYCSDAHKAAAFRLRQRLFDECGVTSLVEAVRSLLFVKCDDGQALINAALVELARHPLIRYSLAGSQATAEPNGLTYPLRAARVHPAPHPADPAQEENISVEMEGEIA